MDIEVYQPDVNTWGLDMASFAWIPFDIAVVIGFMFVGAWLESISIKHGMFDNLIAPVPFGLMGMGMLFFESIGS